jgi:hypothetical protein
MPPKLIERSTSEKTHPLNFGQSRPNERMLVRSARSLYKQVVHPLTLQMSSQMLTENPQKGNPPLFGISRVWLSFPFPCPNVNSLASISPLMSSSEQTFLSLPVVLSLLFGMGLSIAFLTYTRSFSADSSKSTGSSLLSPFLALPIKKRPIF